MDRRKAHWCPADRSLDAAQHGGAAGSSQLTSVHDAHERMVRVAESLAKR
jgi:hypothetical protein